MEIFNELKCYTENKFHQNIVKNQTEKNLWKLSEVFNIEITHICYPLYWKLRIQLFLKSKDEM